MEGNLGFKTTKDRVEAVFRQALGKLALEQRRTDHQAKPLLSDFSLINPNLALPCVQHPEVSPL